MFTNLPTHAILNPFEQAGLEDSFQASVPWLSHIEALPRPCLLCGGRVASPVKRFRLNTQVFHVLRCLHDGLMWLDPQPTAAFYDELYRYHYHGAAEDHPLFEQAILDVTSNVDELRTVARWRVDEMEEFVSPGRLLEVGFGSGWVLREARERGWTVTGLELGDACISEARRQGIEAHYTPFLDFLAPAAFDVVAMFSVLEHVSDPQAYLMHAWKLLRPSGVLILRLPDTDFAGPPASLVAHTYHFNSATISVLLRRCGFEVSRIGGFGLWKLSRYPGSLWNMNVISRKSTAQSAMDAGAVAA